MKEVTTLTVRQDPGEPRLKVRIYTDNLNFYMGIESDDPAVPHFMPLRIRATNFKDAKSLAENYLHLTRGVLRAASEKPPDLPAHMTVMEKETPAFLHYLLTNSFVGQN
jgi:hypothetical protein